MKVKKGVLKLTGHLFIFESKLLNISLHSNPLKH